MPALFRGRLSPKSPFTFQDSKRRLSFAPLSNTVKMDPGFRRGDGVHLGRTDGAFRLPPRSSFRRKPESILDILENLKPLGKAFQPDRGFLFLVWNK